MGSLILESKGSDLREAGKTAEVSSMRPRGVSLLLMGSFLPLASLFLFSVSRALMFCCTVTSHLSILNKGAGDKHQLMWLWHDIHIGHSSSAWENSILAA